MYTLSHFLPEGISKSIIYRVIRRAKNDSGHERVQGRGRIAKRGIALCENGDRLF